MLSRSLALIGVVGVIAWSTPVKSAPETDWWRTDGAAVVQYSLAGEDACSLFLYDRDRAVILTWGKAGTREISFNNSGWSFQANQPIAVAVQIGATWLGSSVSGDPPKLTASASREQLSVPLVQPVAGLLRDATQIIVKLPDRKMSVDVDRRKMPKLLKAVGRCRRALK
jgi:hypothetical protein